MLKCQLQSASNPLSAINYRDLTWTITPDVIDNYEDESLDYTSLQKSKTIRPKDDMMFDQADLEKKYRQNDIIPFIINPRHYSIDCYEDACKIQKHLLSIVGSDEVMLNDPYYIDNFHQRFNANNQKGVADINLNRLIEEHARLRRIKDINEDIVVDRFKYLMTDALENCGCEEMEIEPETECESFDYTERSNIDIDDAPNNMEDLFKWAKEFIYNKLYKKEESKREPSETEDELVAKLESAMSEKKEQVREKSRSVVITQNLQKNFKKCHCM